MKSTFIFLLFNLLLSTSNYLVAQTDRLNTQPPRHYPQDQKKKAQTANSLSPSDKFLMPLLLQATSKLITATILQIQRAMFANHLYMHITGIMKLI